MRGAGVEEFDVGVEGRAVEVERGLLCGGGTCSSSAFSSATTGMRSSCVTVLSAAVDESAWI